MTFHATTFRLLGITPETSSQATTDLQSVEKTRRIQMPASVREWYQLQNAIRILADHSNDDPPIAIRDFAVQEWRGQVLLPIRHENQGVCTWAILLDGSDDPPVYVDVDTDGKEWCLLAPTFSRYVFSCVWDYRMVLNQPALVQAQNDPLTESAIKSLMTTHKQEITTHGWPGSSQYRFEGARHAVLIWSAEGQADWFVGAPDGQSLKSALDILWPLDSLGDNLYDCSEVGREVLMEKRKQTTAV